MPHLFLTTSEMVDEFITAAQQRARADLPRNREEEEAQEMQRLAFSIEGVVEERSLDYIQDAIGLTWEEFLELYQMVKPSLEQKGRGRRAESRASRPLLRPDAFPYVRMHTHNQKDRFEGEALPCLDDVIRSGNSPLH